MEHPEGFLCRRILSARHIGIVSLEEILNPASEIANQLVARRAEKRAEAAAVLSEPGRGLSPVLLVVSVVSASATSAFIALSPIVGFRALIGAVGGGAFAMACHAYGQCERLRKRVEAIEVFLDQADFN